MILSALLVILAAADQAQTGTVARSSDQARIEALVLLSEGELHLSRGEVPEAINLLEQAQITAPDLASVHRDLALAYAQDGRLELGLAHAERAIALGEIAPEVEQLRAMLLIELGDTGEAAAAARAAGTWEGDLLGVVARDLSALDRAAPWVGENTPRGALTALVLAADAAQRGERTSAKTLAASAEAVAERLRSAPMIRAARELGERLGQRAWITGGTRLRTSIDYATNPSYLADGVTPTQSGLRMAVVAEGGVQAPIGIARVDGAVRIDQQVFLNEIEAHQDLDLTGLAVGLSVEVPINDRPAPVLLGVALRFRDTFGDLMKLHYASSIDGGPTLTIPFDLNAGLELGMYGTAIDFIDRSPPDAQVNSQNRDSIGQRAVAAFVFRTGLLEGRLETMFIRDDAVGQAFDSRGGALAGRVKTALPGGIVLSTGFAMTILQFGPVGDETILGAASKRTEVRTLAELGVRIPLAERLAFLVEDVWLRNSARSGHAYTDNVISFGLETGW